MPIKYTTKQQIFDAFAAGTFDTADTWIDDGVETGVAGDIANGRLVKIPIGTTGGTSVALTPTQELMLSTIQSNQEALVQTQQAQGLQLAQLNDSTTAIAGINAQVSDIDIRVGTVEVGQASHVESNVTLDYAANGEDMPTDGSQHAKVLALDPDDYAYPAIVKIQYDDGTTCHRAEGNPLAWVEFRRDANLHSLIALNASSLNNLGLAQSIIANDITKFKYAQDRTGSEYTLTFEDTGFVLEVDNNIIIPAMPAGQEKAIYNFINSSDVDRTISGGLGAGVTIDKGATIIEAGGFLSILIKTADGASTVTVNGGGYA